MQEEVTIKATHDQVVEFINSFIWDDMKNELMAWKDGFMQEMISIPDDVASENPTTASVLVRMGDINGRIKTVNYLLSLPEIFLQILEDRKEDEDK